MTPTSTAEHKRCDVVVIGGGIVGLATALALTDANPSLRFILLEKERDVGTHQTGHNSGVIHSGIYYKPGSLKARLCVDGAREMIAFCARHAIRTDPVGKVIVATTEAELPRLAELQERGIANGVRIERIDAARLHQIEPAAAGIAAIHSPDTAIVDYGLVARTMKRLLTDRGAQVLTLAQVTAIRSMSTSLTVETHRGSVTARRLINCAGLYCDRIAQLMGLDPKLQIIPFRGEYYFFKPDRASLVRGLIYPVPDPNLPFLGVHFTRTIHGAVEAGPNAVLALAREGYRWRDVKLAELTATLRFRGFWKMARTFWRTGAYEMYRSMSKRAFVDALQQLVPAVRGEDLVRGGAGVRAQAVDEDGKLVQDFRFVCTPLSLHVLNAPSPAATASLAIGRYIAQQAQTMLATG